MWDLIVKILPFLKDKKEEQRLKEIQFIVSEVKELREYHKQDAKEQKLINESQIIENIKLQKEMEKLQNELNQLRQNWRQCLKQWRELKDDYTVTFQKLIFKTKGKWKDDDIEKE